jgi:sarcosine/dimethylglycine N-methyltransferase
MNEHLAETAGITGGARVLSIGCGQGGADRYLAKTYGATIVGVDLSEGQLNEARAAASQQGLDGKITYIHASMTDVPVDDNSFDFVWAQEALFLCPEMDSAVREFARVLREGGVAIVEDTVLGKAEAKAEVLSTFGQRVRINDIYTVDEYHRLFERHGFVPLNVEDLSEHLTKTFGTVAASVKPKLDKINQLIPAEHRAKFDVEHGFAKSTQLVAERKLGCVAFFFKKK